MERALDAYVAGVEILRVLPVTPEFGALVEWPDPVARRPYRSRRSGSAAVGGFEHGDHHVAAARRQIVQQREAVATIVANLLRLRHVADLPAVRVTHDVGAEEIHRKFTERFHLHLAALGADHAVHLIEDRIVAI